MAVYVCDVCGYVYDEEKEGQLWADLPDDWACPVCASDKSLFSTVAPKEEEQAAPSESASAFARASDEFEHVMADIHQMADTGKAVIEPMRTKSPTISWDEILFKGAQLATIPLNHEDPVNATTVIGPKAKQPLVIESPVYISHMSFGALSRETKIALAKGSAGVKTAICSGEGGILPEEKANAYRYIFEYVPNEYSVTEENLRSVDAIEIKIGQSAKPGMGGHLPAEKVTSELAALRGRPEHQDITSPANFKDIRNGIDLKNKIDWLREISGGRPIGVKFAAGNIEADLAVALEGGPDFITIDGRAGATGAAPKYVKASTSVPTVFALHRARQYFREHDVSGVSLVITGGLRVSAEFAKALALGADAVAIATAALMACGCQQYRMCHTGECPVGVATQDPELRARLNVDEASRRVKNFLSASTEELKDFARLTGNDDVHKLSISDLCTANSEISGFTDIEHV